MGKVKIEMIYVEEKYRGLTIPTILFALTIKWLDDKPEGLLPTSELYMVASRMVRSTKKRGGQFEMAKRHPAPYYYKLGFRSVSEPKWNNTLKEGRTCNVSKCIGDPENCWHDADKLIHMTMNCS